MEKKSSNTKYKRKTVLLWANTNSIAGEGELQRSEKAHLGQVFAHCLSCGQGKKRSEQWPVEQNWMLSTSHLLARNNKSTLYLYYQLITFNL